MLYHKVQKALTFYLILWVSLLSCVRDLSYILLFKLDNLQQYITWFEVVSSLIWGVYSLFQSRI